MPTPTPTAPSAPTPTPATEPDGWSLFNLIITILTALLMIALFITYFTVKRREDGEPYAKDLVEKHGIIRLISVLFSVGAVILFVLTEEMTQAMHMVDKNTIFYVLIAISQVLVMVFSRKRIKN